MWTKGHVRLLALGITAVLVALGVVRLWQLGSDARRLLESLGLPPGAYDVADIDVEGPDGPMPEIATRSFRVRGDAKALEQFYLERCKREGLSAPKPESVRLEAELVCERWRTVRADSVLLSTRCEGRDCLATLEVHR